MSLIAFYGDLKSGRYHRVCLLTNGGLRFLWLLNGLHINHESILDIAADHTFEGILDPLHRRRLNLRNDSMLRAEIEQFLRLSDAADERSGETPA